MIKANELRIGNWYDHNGRYEQVTPNTILEVWESERTWVKPIPLTTEILEKCGFEQQNGVMAWEKEDVVIAFSTLGNFFRLYPRTNRIKYLHQLQNLYFALTGEELTFKP
jgi:outer membrane protein assembly factor BamD (BamD/ComL family)